MNDHARAQELVPWMVNGRIDSRDHAWLGSHLDMCAACRGELAAQQRVRDAIAREPTVEFAPQAAFNQLWKRIEADTHGASATTGASPTTADSYRHASGPSRRASLRKGPWLRAALAVQAAAIIVLCGVLWQRAAAPAYSTVTDAPAGPAISGPVVKAIFDDQVRLADVKEILAANGFVIAAGPSEAGVYSLVLRNAHATSISPAALARLRADPRVRFAEPAAQ